MAAYIREYRVSSSNWMNTSKFSNMISDTHEDRESWAKRIANG